MIGEPVIRAMQDGNHEDQILRRAVARLRALVMAVTFGATGAAGLFIATVWLLVRGGEDVGRHLGLLGTYLPGYSVTWGGAVLGLFYGAIVGALIGASIAWTYNMIALSRNTSGERPQ